MRKDNLIGNVCYLYFRLKNKSLWNQDITNILNAFRSKKNLYLKLVVYIQSAFEKYEILQRSTWFFGYVVESIIQMSLGKLLAKENFYYLSYQFYICSWVPLHFFKWCTEEFFHLDNDTCSFVLINDTYTHINIWSYWRRRTGRLKMTTIAGTWKDIIFKVFIVPIHKELLN